MSKSNKLHQRALAAAVAVALAAGVSGTVAAAGTSVLVAWDMAERRSRPLADAAASATSYASLELRACRTTVSSSFSIPSWPDSQSAQTIYALVMYSGAEPNPSTFFVFR